MSAEPDQCVVLSCVDSPLSVTGNVIGILTFLGALLITIQVYVNSMRNAERNLAEMMESFQSRIMELQRLGGRLMNQERRNSGHAELSERLSHAMGRVAVSVKEADDLLRRINPGRYDGKRRLWVRAKFIMREELLMKGLGDIEKSIEALKGVANETSYPE